jgi:hypothetical protein
MKVKWIVRWTNKKTKESGVTSDTKRGVSKKKARELASRYNEFASNSGRTWYAVYPKQDEQ